MKQKSFIAALFSVFCMLLMTAPLAAQESTPDAPYWDATLPVEERVEDLLGRMTLEEKIGQMTLIEKNSIPPRDVYDFYIGGILSGGGGYPRGNNTPAGWMDMVHEYQDNALATRLGIPMIYGVDAVHGHSNLHGATFFPHNIGLGAANNPELMTQIGQITAREMIATGIYWDYAPVLAPVFDIRWGRTYESYGENTDLVTALGIPFMVGLQGELGGEGSVLATPKHYIGDGATTWGTSPFGSRNIDRGDTRLDEATLRELLLPPYIAAVEAGAMSIMTSYSSWNGLPMHAHDYLMNNVLKGELGFSGFIVSDWEAVTLISNNDYNDVVTAINAGIDMNMVPYDYRTFIGLATEAVNKGDISLDRIDDAVRRILRVKFAMGLFEHPFGDESLIPTVGSDEHRAVARQAVRESLVLLKNDNAALPIAKDAATIFVAGQGADNLGRQLGGWSIEWQGGSGDITTGTALLEAVKAVVSPQTNVAYSTTGLFDGSVADVGIVVLSEDPYAEFEGDNNRIGLSRGEIAMLKRMRESSKTLVVVLYSGRPLIVTEELLAADAFVAAWLPGTEGAGVTDVLFGDAPFSGKLSFTWPRTVEQLPFDVLNIPTEGCDAPLFPFGYGLTVEDGSASEPWLALAAECFEG
jgi:beta-glucosidase